MENKTTKIKNDDQIDDETIILQILYNYPNAIEDFVNKYQGQLYASLRYQFRTFDKSECKSITIEAFEKAIKKFSLYDPKKGKLRPWLFKIAKTTAIDRIRKINREKNPPEKQEETLHKDLAKIKKEGFIFDIENIKEGLLNLTEDEKIVLNAFLFEYENLEGLTKYLAEKLETTVGNIRVVKLRGKRKLIEFLKKGGSYESK